MRPYIAWIIIVIVLSAAVILYGWLVGGWFDTGSSTENESESSRKDEVLSDQEIEFLDNQSEADARLMSEAEQTMMAVQLYSLDNNSLPANLEPLVPDYLPQIYSEINYKKISDNKAAISVPLSESESELMAADEGNDPDLYELSVEISGGVIP